MSLLSTKCYLSLQNDTPVHVFVLNKFCPEIFTPAFTIVTSVCTSINVTQGQRDALTRYIQFIVDTFLQFKYTLAFNFTHLRKVDVKFTQNPTHYGRQIHGQFFVVTFGFFGKKVNFSILKQYIVFFENYSKSRFYRLISHFVDSCVAVSISALIGVLMS